MSDPHTVKTTIEVITDSKEFLKIEHLWNLLVDESFASPFLLSGFVKQSMDSSNPNDWSPLLLMFSVNGHVVGFAPLAIKTKFGIRSVKFLFDFTYHPDFIVPDQHRELFIEHILDFLFKNLNCKFLDFSLHANSPNLPILKRYCRHQKINFSIAREMGNNVIQINGDWTQYESLRGRNFKKQFRRLKNCFDHAGSWKIVCTQGNNPVEVIQRILDVERLSWKEKCRALRSETLDPSLMFDLEAAQHTARIEPSFTWKVYFLNLNERILAYVLVFQYKETAFLVKTSYDERYKKLSPGSFLQYFVVREFFGTMAVKSIDFVTDLEYHRRWTSTCLPRIRIMIANGTLPTIWKRMSEYSHLSKIMWFVSGGLTMFESLEYTFGKNLTLKETKKYML